MGRAGRELQVQLLLDDLLPAVVALSETEIPEEDSVMFKNYKVYYPLAVEGKGFRLLLLIREDYVTKYNPVTICSSPKEIWLRLESPVGAVAIGSIYRQWTDREEEDLDEIGDRFRTLSAGYDHILAIGDMNLDVARVGDPSYYRRRLLRRHMECMAECGLDLANELDMSPTFVSHGTFKDKNGTSSHKYSVLDHVYYSGFPPPAFAVLPIAMTDHRPTLSKFDLLHKRPNLKTVRCRNFKSIDTATICCTINATTLSKVFDMDNVEDIHNVIVDEINTALDLIAPMEQVQLKDRRTPLYLSAETRAAMSWRDAAAATGNHAMYRHLRNRTARLVRRDKLESNTRHLEAQGLDPKAIWHLANTATGRTAKSNLPAGLVDEEDGSSIKGEANLADCMNRYYISKIDTIRERIEETKVTCSIGDEQQQQQQRQQQDRFRFRSPSEKEVVAAIMGLNNTPAIGVDGIPVVVLKQVAPVIAAPVAHLIKMSFKSSMVPTGFKKASIVPLHKRNKPPRNPSSYRPVAILAALSKVIERVVLQQVSPHLAALLPPEQFGFRPKRSTSAAIAYAHGSWVRAKAEGLMVAIVGYDLSSAFDTIDVDMVSNKLQGFGVVKEENRWFHNYLSDRKQQVRYNSSRSSYRDVRYGVPQGSILGPLLFLVLVADLPGRISSLSPPAVSTTTGSNNREVKIGFSAYADDTIFWVAGRTVEAVKDKMEQVSGVIVNYACQNYLALNETKTQVLWTTPKGTPIKVGSSLVEPSDSLEVLGVKFDKQLTTNPHLSSLNVSARSMTAVANRLALHLPRNSLKSVMGALVRGKIGYACMVLTPRFNDADPSSMLMNQLQVNSNNAARTIIGVKNRDKIRVEDLLEEASLPSLNRLVIYTIAIECWRALSLRDVHNGPLNPLGTLLSRSRSCSRTRAANSGCLPPPAKHMVDSFIWWDYTCWNASPALRAAATMSAAKKAAHKLAMTAPL